MKTKKLDRVSITRMAELVSAYMDPPERFNVNQKGEVSFNQHNALMRKLKKLDDISFDFMESTSLIIEGIGNAKGNTKGVELNCTAAFQHVVKNERREAIKKLYIAHLLEANEESNNMQSGKPKGVEITIEQKGRGTHKFYKQNLIQDVEDILNGADAVIYRGR